MNIDNELPQNDNQSSDKSAEQKKGTGSIAGRAVPTAEDETLFLDSDNNRSTSQSNRSENHGEVSSDLAAYKKFEPVFGSWRIARKIGAGSFGAVFEIEREDFGTKYRDALKIITIPKNQAELDHIRGEGMSENETQKYIYGIAEKIVDEFVLMSKLKGNSNIVSYEDHQVIKHQDGLGWDILIRMELLTPMSDYFSNKTLSERDVIKLGIDMCQALEICHKQNIIHRDIKPENIFISENGDFKLGDFGIAKQLADDQRDLTKVGTPSYMAPEVYRGKNYDMTVDIYSVGMVMYRLLNYNRAPFMPQYPNPFTYADKNTALVKRMEGKEKMLPPSNASAALSAVILKACEFNPSMRYRTPEQFRLALENVLAGGAVSNKVKLPDAKTIAVVAASAVAVLGIACAFAFGGRNNPDYTEKDDTDIIISEDTYEVDTEVSSMVDTTEEDTSVETDTYTEQNIVTADDPSDHAGTVEVNDNMATLYDSDGNEHKFPADEVDQRLNEGYYADPPVKVYKPATWNEDGVERIVTKKNRSKYLEDGWYTQPHRVLYSYDDRTRVTLESEVEAYLNVGWYMEPFQMLYRENGAPKKFKMSEVGPQLTVGWYEEPVYRIYNRNNYSMLVEESDLQGYLNSGWSTTKYVPRKDTTAVTTARKDTTAVTTAPKETQAAAPEKNVTLYKLGGATVSVPESKVDSYVSQGWHRSPVSGHVDSYIAELKKAKPTDQEFLKHANATAHALIELKQYIQLGVHYTAYYSTTINRSVDDSDYDKWHPVDDSRVKSLSDVQWVWNCYFADDPTNSTPLKMYHDIDGKLCTASQSDVTLPSFTVKFTRVKYRTDSSVELVGEYTEKGSSKQTINYTLYYIDSKWKLGNYSIID